MVTVPLLAGGGQGGWEAGGGRTEGRTEEERDGGRKGKESIIVSTTYQSQAIVHDL